MLQTAYNNIENNMSDHACERNLKLESSKFGFTKHGSESNFSNEIPHTISTLKDRLCISPAIIKNICCKKCFSLYEYKPHSQHSTAQSGFKTYTQRLTCNSIELGQYGRRGVCGGNLWTPTQQHTKQHPEKMFFHQSLKEWLGRQLLWPGYEDLLDSHLYQSQNTTSEYNDIWDGKMWKNFKGIDGSSFTKKSGNLIFGLYLDWVDPFGHKILGKTN